MSFAHLRTLHEFYAQLVKGEVKISSYTEQGYALLYKGEVIAQGNFKQFYEELTGIFKQVKNGKFEEVLEGSLWIKKNDEAIKKLGITNIPKNTLSAIQSKIRLQNVLKSLAGNKRLVFNPNKAALKKLGIKLPKSKTGLSVDFADTHYLYPAKGNEKAIVKIKLTGVRRYDDKLAYELARIKLGSSDLKKYTWHHLDDYNPIDGTCTVQLVETKIHVSCYPHIGSVNVIERFLNINYK